jgi:hypothetical protein
MAQGFMKHTTSGKTFYQRRVRLDGTTIMVQNPTTGAWANNTSWANSAKAITELSGMGSYLIDLSDLPQMWLDLLIYEQLGASPDASDTLVDSGSIHTPVISPMMMGSAR